jgi:hypothetical protein
MINRERYEAIRIPIQDYLRSKYEPLDAELQLGQARAQAARP